MVYRTGTLTLDILKKRVHRYRLYGCDGRLDESLRSRGPESGPERGPGLPVDGPTA